MKDKTMRNLLKILGCALAVLLIGGCQGPLSFPKQDAPESSGRAIIRIGETGARSLVPTINPDFSKYELVFTAAGKTDVTRTIESETDRLSISNSGYAVELDEAEWNVAVSAFVWGTDSTYLEAARGAGSFTVNAANPNPGVFIVLDPLVMDGAAKGIFTWNLNLDGVTGSPSVSGTITPVDSSDSINLVDQSSPVSSSFNWSGNWTQTGTNQYTSNSISDSGSTWETLVITAPSLCGITVTLTASSESNFDYGYASRLDGSPSKSDYQFRVSGAQSQTYTYTVPAGTHYLYFGYTKDSFGYTGNDNVVVEVAQTNGTPQTLYNLIGSQELASGYYRLGFTVTKGNMSVGVYRAVHIYPGLTTTAEGADFTFTDADFVEQKYIAGTVAITGVPQDKTVEWVKVQPYQEAAFTTPLAEEVSATQNGSWFLAIPAGAAGVYFKATMKLADSAAEYDLDGGSETDLPASGKKGIALAPVYEIPIPAVPSGVTAAALSGASIQVTWNRVPSAESYKVYYGTSSSSVTNLLTTTADTSYIDTGLQPSTAYYYSITAVNSVGESAASDTVSTTTTLNAPAGVTAAAQSSSSILITWNTVPGASGYKVYYYETSGISYTLLTTTTSASYTHTGLQPGTTYQYWVTAVNSAGESSYSSPASAATDDLNNGHSVTRLTAGTWVSGNIASNDTEQWFRFTATAGTQYIHLTLGTLTDLYVQVYSNNDIAIESRANLSGSNGHTKSISRTLTVGAEYYIKVTPYYSGSLGSGTYRIAFSNTLMPPGISTPTLSANTWRDSDMLSSENQQWFRFTATAATQYIHVKFGGLTDLYVQVYDSSINTVGNRTNLDGSNGYTKYISRTLTVGAEYYIQVTPYYSGSLGSGTYRIAFSNTLMPPDTIPIELSQENVWTQHSMTTEQYGQQWFRFTATAATQYIHVTFGTLTDLYVQVYDSSVNAVGNRTNLYGSTKSISRSLTSGEVYYVKVEPYSSGATGTYQIAFNTSGTAP
jgi:fibronectin type 3 domain-containing protein